MSLLVALFYWVLIPIIAVLGSIFLLRTAKTRTKQWLAIGICSIGFLGLTWIYVGEKMYWDAKVRSLCAKDGGIKVYETVKLPAERFGKLGVINFYRPTRGPDTLGNEYLVERKTDYIRRGSPEMRRAQVGIFQKADGKLLGEAVSYHRVGGDLPGPWHTSSFRCPKNSGEGILIQRVFVKTR